MAAPPNTYTEFGPDPPVATIPADFRACLPPAQGSAACDLIVGSSASGLGFCGDPRWRQTTYCACVNNSVGCPSFSMAACANSAHAYKPYAWYQSPQPGQLSPYETCAKSPICVNLVEVGGSQNVVSGITQQCGAITNLTRLLKANPVLAAAAFVLVIALIVVLSSDTVDSSAPAAPGAAPQGPLWTGATPLAAN